MTALLDLVSERFGRLTVIERADDWQSPTSAARQVQWLCRCACGTELVVLAASLRSGATQSCGCHRRDKTTTHGMYGTPTYLTWAAMIARCTRPSHKSWEHYGGRGITVCDRWQSFDAFLADVGERPDGTSLDRIDVNGNYEPGNCRWANSTEQRANQRRNTTHLENRSTTA